MTQADNRMALLARVPVAKALAALGLPIMVGMLVNALYNVADACFVAQLGEASMGAISVAFPLGQVAVGIGLLWGSGAASYASRLLGRGDYSLANAAVSTAVYGALACGVVYAGAVLIFLGPVLEALGARGSVLPLAVAYGGIYGVSGLLSVYTVTMNNVLASEGAAKTAMGSLVAGACVNIVFDPLLIYGCGLGVAGAAWATLLGQAVSTVIYGAYARSGRSTFGFAWRSCCFSRTVCGEIAKIGVPTLVFQLLGSLAIALTNRMAAPYGEGTVAALGAAARVMALGSLPVFGFLKGMQPIAGFSYGAGDFKRLWRVVRVAVVESTVFCAVFGLGVAVGAPVIMGLFLAPSSVAFDTGVAALRASGAAFVLFGYYTVYSSLMLALGRGRDGLVLGSCRQGLCFVPALVVLVMLAGLAGVAYAQAVADGLAFGVALVMARRLRRQLTGLVPMNEEARVFTADQ